MCLIKGIFNLDMANHRHRSTYATPRLCTQMYGSAAFRHTHPSEALLWIHHYFALTNHPQRSQYSVWSYNGLCKLLSFYILHVQTTRVQVCLYTPLPNFDLSEQKALFRVNKSTEIDVWPRLCYKNRNYDMQTDHQGSMPSM